MTQRRGVAIILVVTVLAVMLLIAVPFALSMRASQRRASRSLDVSEIRFGADGAIDAAKDAIYARGAIAKTLSGASADAVRWDSIESIQPDFTNAIDAMAANATGRTNDKSKPRFATASAQSATFKLQDGGSLTLTASVEDEQGKININATDSRTLARAFGSALIVPVRGGDETYRRVSGEKFAVYVDDYSDFRTDGDDKTVDGYVAFGLNDESIYSEFYPYVGTDARNGAILVTGEPPDGVAIIYDARGFIIRDWATRNPDSTGAPYVFGSVYEMRLATFTPPNGRKPEPVVILPDEMRRFERLLTVRSWRPAPFSRFFTVYPSSVSVSERRIVAVISQAGDTVPAMAPGSRIRYIDGNGTIGSTVITFIDFLPNGIVQLYPELLPISAMPTLNASLMVQVEQPAPVNINTASDELLEALFEIPVGVSVDGNEPADLIGRLDRITLANYIRQRRTGEPIKSLSDFGRMIGIAVEDDHLGIYPYFNNNVASMYKEYATPLTFRSENDFTIFGSALRRDATGFALARRRIKEQLGASIPSPGIAPRASLGDHLYSMSIDETTGRGWTTTPYNITSTTLSDAANYPHPLYLLDGIDVMAGGVTPAVHRNYLSSSINGNRYNLSDPKYSYVDIQTGRRVIRALESPNERYDGAILGQSSYCNSISISRNPSPIEISAWFKPTGATRNSTIYDLSAANGSTCHLTFAADQFMLTFEGAELEPDAQTVWRFKHSFEPDIWHHIALWCSGNRTSRAMLAIDGQPFATDELDSGLAARLTSSASDTGTLSVDLSGFPPAGYVFVGGEIVGYSTDLSGSPVWNRGACETTAATHSYNCLVERQGFTLNADADYLALTGELADSLNVNDGQARLTVDIDAGATDILITPDASRPLQTSGYVLIGTEVLFYASKTATSLSCTGGRGQLGSTAAIHSANTTVNQLSIAVKAFTGYPTQPTIVQVRSTDDPSIPEWIQYNQCVVGPNNEQYLLGPTNTMPTRAAYGTVRVNCDLTAGSGSLVPIHSGSLSQYKLIADENGPFNVPVTLIDISSKRRERYDVMHAALNGSSLLWALDRNPSATYSRRPTRLLRYPCNDLNLLPFTSRLGLGQASSGSPNTARPLTGLVDDLIIARRSNPGTTLVSSANASIFSPLLPGYVPSQGVLITGQTVRFMYDGNGNSFNGSYDFDNPGAVQEDAGTLADFARGVEMSVVRSTALKPFNEGLYTVNQTDDDKKKGSEFKAPEVIQTVTIDGGKDYAEDYGTILNRSSDEIFHYTSRKGTVLWVEPTMTGRYGTVYQPVELGNVLQQLPVRHFDGYVERRHGYSEHFIEFRDSRPGALWDAFYFKLDAPPQIRVKYIMRIVFDEAVPFSSPPVRTPSPDALFETVLDHAGAIRFPKGHPLEGYQKLSLTSAKYKDGIPADSVRARVYVKYETGAYSDIGDWKASPPAITGWAFGCSRRERVWRRDVVDE
ncbi:MAG: LamG-like jellyroll fold domain-containing protein [Planctomycetota bacterium]